MSKSLKCILIIIIVSIGIKATYSLTLYFVKDNHNAFSFHEYKNMIARNDTGWYKKIADNWYPKVNEIKELGFVSDKELIQSPWAFFPLYPAINRVMMKVFNVPFLNSATYWSIIFSTLAFIGFFIFCHNYLKDAKKALFCTLLFMVFPTHYYFSMMYTEAPFFTFLIFSFIAIQTRKFYWVPLLLIPLVLLRSYGVIALIPLYLYYLETENMLSWKKIDFKKIFSKGNIGRSMIFITGPLTFIAYLLYQKYMTGEYFAFSIAQVGWYKEFTWPHRAIFRLNDMNSTVNRYITLLAMVYALWIARKLPLSLNILIWTSLLLPLTAGSTQSMGRYISIIYPFTLMLGLSIYRYKIRYPALVILLGLQLYLFSFWIEGHKLSF
jgi:hypothetical protein